MECAPSVAPRTTTPPVGLSIPASFLSGNLLVRCKNGQTVSLPACLLSGRETFPGWGIHTERSPLRFVVAMKERVGGGCVKKIVLKKLNKLKKGG
jgi:hypothetical protein